MQTKIQLSGLMAKDVETFKAPDGLTLKEPKEDSVVLTRLKDRPRERVVPIDMRDWPDVEITADVKLTTWDAQKELNKIRVGDRVRLKPGAGPMFSYLRDPSKTEGRVDVVYNFDVGGKAVYVSVDIDKCYYFIDIENVERIP